MTDFAGWLRKGLGRTAVFLKTNDGTPHHEALLYGCTHNLKYDAQCEDTRAPYLIDLIELSGDARFYRDGILNALNNGPPDGDEGFDLGQLFELAAHFAARGDAEMKQSMYTVFEGHGIGNAGLLCAEQLVRLDGVAGLMFVSKSFDQIETHDRPWQFGILMEILEKRDGKQPLPGALDGLVGEWREYEEHSEKERQKPAAVVGYSEVKNRIMEKGRSAGLVFWSKSATDNDMEKLADDLLAESDSDRLYGFLRMFQLRKFPREPARLFELARGEDEEIARAAMTALSHFCHPEIRSLAIEAAKNPEWRDVAVKMLIHNRGVDDYRFIEGLLTEQIDTDAYHSLGFDVRDFIEAHRSAEAEPSLLLLYENGPCTLCRRAVVKQLIAINRLPDWMREECGHDADLDTRGLVA